MPLLELPQPFDFDVSTERFRVFGADPANLWHEGGLHRVVDGRELRIEAAPGGVRVEPPANGDAAVVLTMLGASFDLPAFYEFAQDDPVLARLTRELDGFRPPLAADPFEALVGSILAQQVSMYAAFAIRGRLIERYGKRAEHAWAFPTRDRLARVREEEFVALGFSRRKAEYVIGLAHSDLDFSELRELADEQVKARITSIRGLGQWTAEWFLARHLGRPRAWPVGDLALQKAVLASYGTDDLRAVRDRFAPFENLTAHYLLTGARVVGA